ncbi:MAG: glycoside hydrolase family 2, partial [Planctomycetes bacterium]|nr:glycoside hydrolase family 2 [Planctomycetota bacterium]
MSVACADRSVEVLTSGWRFTRGEQRRIAVRPAFDDSDWQVVRVPHDWAIAGPFDEEANGYAGKLPWQGQGWYRKILTLQRADAGKRVYLDFDGVMSFCKVYINGQLAGEWDYGYSPFRVDATDFVTFGEDNTLAVHVDMETWGTRWYPGAGLYRKVTLTLCHPVHIANWGQVITTPSRDPKTVPNAVRVRTTLENHGAEAGPVTIQVALFDPSGTRVALDERIENIDAHEAREVDQAFYLASPKLWDVKTPNLYTAQTTVSQGGKVLDSLTSSFGVRSFEFTANDGFHLNGKRVQLFGVNLHHDQGPLGAAFHVRAMARQLEIMQDMGVNALRTSHN